MAAENRFRKRPAFRFYRIAVILSCSIHTANGQHDSLNIPEVQVAARISDRTALREPGSMAVVSAVKMQNRVVASLLPALSLEPGVRMEERSPGSYRLSIRGSLLRSPFGIRNIKAYIGEMPLTNAAGETYLNLVDQKAVSRIEIHKGPDGSIFGANSGGVVRLTLGNYDRRYAVEGMTGSFGLYRAGVAAAAGKEAHRIQLLGSVQGAEGYRDHTAMDRKYAHAGYRRMYGTGSSLEVFALGSALRYETPGGLTLAQFNADPKQARPQSATLPGAVTQAAGVHNLTGMVSVTNNTKLSKAVSHMVCIFGSATEFSNPAITNYERRSERNAGVRTWVRHRTGELITLQSVLGAELQWHHALFNNFVNNGGVAGQALGLHKFLVAQQNLFTSVLADLYNRVLLEGSAGMNFSRLLAGEQGQHWKQIRSLEPQLMPRIAASVFVLQRLAVRGVISRGYSPPTLQELRPVPAAFNYSLQPESGWNYELGVRAVTGAIRVDATVFFYRLRNAITRQVDASGDEYFVNAGETRQPGLEIQTSWNPIRSDAVLNALQLTAGAQLYDFSFGTYRVGGSDFSGNQLTGVPAHVFMGEVTLPLTMWLDLRLQSITVSGAPLDEANSAFSDGYTAMTTILRFARFNVRKYSLVFNVGCDNVLDQRYSLGPDLNAFGGRFYNPAPGRNYFAQLGVGF